MCVYVRVCVCRVCVCVCVCVATKILAAAPVNDSLQCVTLQALVYHILPPQERGREAEYGVRPRVCVCARACVCVFPCFRFTLSEMAVDGVKN